jgi:putative Ca2+/H+ antiporter (TMEM165/GDT1 family)
MKGIRAVDWRLLIGTFGLLFLAELGDKTQLVVITMTSRTGKPIPVLLGAVAALVVVTILGVLVGTVVTRFVPLEWVSRGSAVAFIAIGVLMLTGKL